MQNLNKIGQVWIETVLYTLIGLSLIALILAFVTPRINESKDQVMVEQTINSLNEFDNKIYNVIDIVGNRRYIDLTIKRGNFYITSSADSISFVFDDLTKPYSELGVEINISKIKILSSQNQKANSIYLTLQMPPLVNLTYAGKEITKKFQAASLPYRIYIENKGGANGIYNIDLWTSPER